MWHEQVIIEWSRHVLFFVSSCRSAALCTCCSGFPIAMLPKCLTAVINFGLDVQIRYSRFFLQNSVRLGSRTKRNILLLNIVTSRHARMHRAMWSVCGSVVFAHLQFGIDPRTSGRMDCGLIDVNSSPDESAKESSYFHVHGSHTSVACLVFPFLLRPSLLTCSGRASVTATNDM